MNHFRLSSCALLLVVAGYGPGCKTIGKVNKLLDEARATAKKAGNVADNVPQMVSDAADTAKEAVTESAATFGGIPKVAAMYTGGVDVGRTSPGRRGTMQGDVDGDGTQEDISVFIDDRDETFLAFELSEADGRDCYTVWDEPDAVWMIVTECGDQPDGELIDVCAWDHNGSNLECVGLTCAGDVCQVDLCYNDVEEIPCEFDVDDADTGVADEDPGDGSTGDIGDIGDTEGSTGGEDPGEGDCESAVLIIDDAYSSCGLEGSADCSVELGDLEACADALLIEEDVCTFLDSAEGFELCPW